MVTSRGERGFKFLRVAAAPTFIIFKSFSSHWLNASLKIKMFQCFNTCTPWKDDKTTPDTANSNRFVLMASEAVDKEITHCLRRRSVRKCIFLLKVFPRLTLSSTRYRTVQVYLHPLTIVQLFDFMDRVNAQPNASLVNINS